MHKEIALKVLDKIEEKIDTAPAMLRAVVAEDIIKENLSAAETLEAMREGEEVLEFGMRIGRGNIKFLRDTLESLKDDEEVERFFELLASMTKDIVVALVQGKIPNES